MYKANSLLTHLFLSFSWLLTLKEKYTSLVESFEGFYMKQPCKMKHNLYHTVFFSVMVMIWPVATRIWISVNCQVTAKLFYHINCGVIQGFPALRKAVTTHVKKYSQSATNTSLAFSATQSGWWMNGKAFTHFSIVRVSANVLYDCYSEIVDSFIFIH